MKEEGIQNSKDTQPRAAVPLMMVLIVRACLRPAPAAPTPAISHLVDGTRGFEKHRGISGIRKTMNPTEMKTRISTRSIRDPDDILGIGLPTADTTMAAAITAATNTLEKRSFLGGGFP